MRKVILTYYILFLSFIGFCQGFHFSQYFGAPLSVSPAYSGIFDYGYRLNQVRIASLYRQQWWTIQSNFLSERVPFVSSGISIDAKLNPITKQNRARITIGGGFTNHKAGDLGLQYYDLFVNTGANLVLDKQNRHVLTIGLTGHYYQNRIEPSEGRYDNQWNGSSFDPSLPSGESFPTLFNTHYNYSLGGAYHLLANTKLSIDLFYGIHNVAPLNEKIYIQEAVSHQRQALQLTTNYVFSPLYDISWSLIHMSKDRTMQTMGMGMFGFKVPRKKFQLPIKHSTGLMIRVNQNITSRMSADAVALLYRFELNNSLFGLSYDINVSTLYDNTSSVGAIEFSFVQYLNFASRIRPNPFKGDCPNI